MFSLVNNAFFRQTMSLDLDEEPGLSVAELGAPEQLSGRVWCDGGFDVDSLCAVTEDVVAVTNGACVKLVFLKTGKSRSLLPEAKGISCLAGRDDLSVVGWSDSGITPDVHVFQYAAPTDVKNMKGDASLEYVRLAFNSKNLLIGLSGVPDFKLTLWNWKAEETICSINTSVKSVDAYVTFSPDFNSKNILVASESTRHLSLFKVKRCGQERTLLEEPLADAANRESLGRHLAVNMHQGEVLFVVTDEHRLFKWHLDSLAATEISVDKSIFASSQQLQLRSHYDGLIVFTLSFISTLHIHENSCEETRRVDLEHKLCHRVVEFVSTFSYISWTTTGNIFLVQTDQKAVASKTLWRNEKWPSFSDVAFVEPDGVVLAALDQPTRLKLFDVIGKDDILTIDLGENLSFMLAHPRIPVLVFGSHSGRLLGVALTLTLTRVKESYQDDELTEESETCTEQVFRARARSWKSSRRLHRMALSDQAAWESLEGDYFAVASIDGTIFLVNGDEGKGVERFLEPLDSASLEGSVVDLSFRGDILLCLMKETSSSKHVDQDFAGRRVHQFRVLNGQLEALKTIKLKDFCSGIALDIDARGFFTLQVRKKAIALYHSSRSGVDTEKFLPTTKVTTSHQMGLSELHLLQPGEGEAKLLTAGRDGKFQLLPASLRGFDSSERHLLHHRRGGIRRVAWNLELQSFAATDGRGALVLFEVHPEAATLVRHRTQPIPETNFVSALREALAEEVDDEALPWSELVLQQRLEAEKAAFSSELESVTGPLAQLKVEVSALLKSNGELSEEVPRAEFELNVEEKQKRLAASNEREALLKVELRARHVAKKNLATTLRKQLWDDVDVRGKAIKALSKEMIVHNYPLLPLSLEDTKALQHAKNERDLSLAMLDLTDRIKKASDSTEHLTSSSVIKELSLDESPDGSVDMSVKANERFLGSLSHRYVEETRYQLDQRELTTRMQTRQQIILLKDIIRRLKVAFNKEFDDLFQRKDDVFAQVKGWLASLMSLAEENPEGEENAVIRYKMTDFQWSATENPELDLPLPLRKLTKKAAVDPTDATSPRMPCGGKSELSLNQTEKVVKRPAFMQEKRSVDYSPAEISSKDEFQAENEQRIKGIRSTRRGRFNDRISLERSIQEVVASFDRDLTRLYAHKLDVEACVANEELKILLLDLKLATMDQLDKEEERLQRAVAAAEARVKTCERELQTGKEALESLRVTLATMNDKDKALEKNFKKEFPGLNYNQLEALMKSYRLRPRTAEATFERTVDLFTRKEIKRRNLNSTLGGKKSSKDLHSKSIASTLERMSNMFLGTALTKPTAQASSLPQNFVSLDDLDKPSCCPENVDLDSWRALCILRRRKIDSERQIANVVADLAETEEAVEDREAAAQRSAESLAELKSTAESWRKQKNRTINNVDVVLTLKRGQIEVERTDTSPKIEGALLLTENVIGKLNHDIENLGESKLNAMKESKDFRAGTRMLRWEKEKLTMELQDLESTWSMMQQIKLSKESQQMLQSKRGARTAVTEDYNRLDEARQAAEEYLERKFVRLSSTVEELEVAKEANDDESDELAKEIHRLEVEVNFKRSQVEEKRRSLKEAEGKTQRVTLAMKRNALQKKIKEQHELMTSLQRQLDTYIYSSFPSLG